MSEEIKKNAQDVELNPEELDKVAGGKMEFIDDGPWYCGVCGAECFKDAQGRLRCPNGH